MVGGPAARSGLKRGQLWALCGGVGNACMIGGCNNVVVFRAVSAGTERGMPETRAINKGDSGSSRSSGF